MAKFLPIILLLLMSCSGSQLPAKTERVIITFYSSGDNDPAESKAIAYPNKLHQEAGGTGTFKDPITVATKKGRFPVGTKIYVPDFKKYLVVEDTCAYCEEQWIDIWMESGNAPQHIVENCQRKWTRWRENLAEIEINPPAGKQVDTTSFFDIQESKCR